MSRADRRIAVRGGEWGRRESLRALVAGVDSERPEGLEPRVDRHLAVVVRARGQLLAALGAEAGTIGPAQRRDRLGELDRLADERLELDLVVARQPGDLRLVGLVERGPAGEVDAGQRLLVDVLGDLDLDRLGGNDCRSRRGSPGRRRRRAGRGWSG